MRYLQLAAFLLIVITVSSVFCEEKKEYQQPDNFMGVEFGSSKSKLVEVLAEEGIEHKVNDTLDLVYGRGITLGKKKVGITFSFFKDKLVGFLIEGYRNDSLHFYRTLAQCNDFAQYFKSLYGVWSEFSNPSFKEIRPNTIAYSHKWSFKDYRVFVGIIGTDSYTVPVAGIMDENLWRKRYEQIMNRQKEKD